MLGVAGILGGALSRRSCMARCAAPGSGWREPWRWLPPSSFRGVAHFLDAGARFNFSGGVRSPEFAALLFGLIVYTAAFIAEIVRSGIQGVSRGQSEAARRSACGAARCCGSSCCRRRCASSCRRCTSEYLALTKNSSLAVAIGYPELMSITNTTLNQTGQAVEAITLMMAIYLAHQPRHLAGDELVQPRASRLVER